jgi:WD40 repeat protein
MRSNMQKRDGLMRSQVNAEVYVFDYTKHASKPEQSGACSPDIRLTGHQTEVSVDCCLLAVSIWLSWLVAGRCRSFCTCCPVAVSRHTAARPGSATLSKLRVHKFLDRDLCAATLQGYGLAWSGFREGYLLSGSDDAQICLWDINAANSKMLGAMAIYHQHLGVVEVTTYRVILCHWLGTRHYGLMDMTRALVGPELAAVLQHQWHARLTAMGSGQQPGQR